MNANEARTILNDVHVPDFAFHVVHQDNDYYLQGRYMEADIVTSDQADQHTRKWRLSVHMTKSEVVQTAFKCYLTSMEHRARESFRYKGKLIFGPHYDVDALVGLCRDENLDYRRG